MSIKKPRPSPRSRSNNPISKDDAPPDGPRKDSSAGKKPSGDDATDVASKEAANSINNGFGEDPMLESGLPEHDPERPRDTPEEQSNR